MIPWDDNCEADPLADLRDAAKQIAEDSGLRPNYTIMSFRMKRELEEFEIWLARQKRELERLPWWAVMRYLVIAKQVDFSRRGIFKRWLHRRKLHYRYEHWRFERKYGDEW